MLLELAIRVAPLALCQLLAGCAIRHVDHETGVTHVWGFGHLTMRTVPPREGVQAIVTGDQTLGLAIQVGKRESGLITGWASSQRMTILDDNVALCLEGDPRDLFSLRVGTTLVDPEDASPQPDEGEDNGETE